MPDKHSTRYTLIKRATEHDDQKAWDTIIRFYQTYIYYILQSLKLNEDECDELFQIVSFQIWKSLHSYDVDNTRTKFRYWVRSVTKNQAYSFLRKKASHRSNLTKFQNQPLDQHENPAVTELEEEEELQWKIFLTNTAVQNIKNDFSPKALKAFDMFRSGTSPDVIGQTLDVTTDCVYKYISRLKERLTKEIKHLSDELDF